MAEQEAQQEWQKGVRYHDDWYELEAGEHVTDPMPEWLVDRILADHKAQQEVRELRLELESVKAGDWWITNKKFLDEMADLKAELARVKEIFIGAALSDSAKAVSAVTAEAVADLRAQLQAAEDGRKALVEETANALRHLRVRAEAAEAERDEWRGQAVDHLKALALKVTDLATATALLQQGLLAVANYLNGQSEVTSGLDQWAADARAAIDAQEKA